MTRGKITNKVINDADPQYGKRNKFVRKWTDVKIWNILNLPNLVTDWMKVKKQWGHHYSIIHSFNTYKY